ncbi:hypothetical protein [Georgenia yuyongxinii]|uniref:Uncharacterized protein n=1 Tax=Georgenia yuyongxinii TaxID=2589797 RepID=A0A552WXF0_9MICO|nr:hypothetical protein [Georgenia yuyongxinii]TRW47457.1 hypothetical protein FJ693_01270 [Georgenia yuyongxinii]
MLLAAGLAYLLDADGDAIALLRGDEVVGIVGVVSDVDLNSVDPACEPARASDQVRRPVTAEAQTKS